MNAKILTVIIGLLFLLPAGYAATYKFPESCPEDPDDSGDASPYYREYHPEEPGSEGGETGNYATPSNRTTGAHNHTDGSGHYGYLECGPDGDRLPPDLVTGHTVYAKWVMEDKFFFNNTLGLPTDFAALAGYFVDVNLINVNNTAERECVVWFNGNNLDMRPDPDAWDGTNDFPSDEDQPVTPTGDASYQDYDFDRDVPDCDGRIEHKRSAAFQYGDFAVAVERGDCNPGDGQNFRFRGHLDFVDPNGIYHEVQEYDYNCMLDIPFENYLCDDSELLDDESRAATTVPSQDTGVDADNDSVNESTPGFGGAGAGDWGCNNTGGAVFGIGLQAGAVAVSTAVNALFPWTYTDPHNFNGCDVYSDTSVSATDGPEGDPTAEVTPDSGDGHPEGSVSVTNGTASNNTTATAHVQDNVDLGHKCNGTIQDLFKERLWITRVHAPVFDATLQDYYTFALMVDTCSGLNMYELTGKKANGSGATMPPGDDLGNSYDYTDDSNSTYTNNAYDDATRYPGDDEFIGTGGSFATGAYTKFYHDNVYDTYYDLVPEGKFPLPDVCTDGSSFSFDDTNRGRVVHDGPGSLEDIMRGNSFGVQPDGGARHREHCRDVVDNRFFDKDDEIDWPLNQNPPGTDPSDCYAEDHKTAQVDLYVYDFDPTSQFELHNVTVDWNGSSGNEYSAYKTEWGEWRCTESDHETEHADAPTGDPFPEDNTQYPDYPDDGYQPGEAPDDRTGYPCEPGVM